MQNMIIMNEHCACGTYLYVNSEVNTLVRLVRARSEGDNSMLYYRLYLYEKYIETIVILSAFQAIKHG